MSIRRLFAGLYRRCLCGCGILIPCFNKMGNFAQYKKGHNIRNRIKKKGIENHRWKGGKSNQKDYITIRKPHFKYCDKNGYVREHRYIMHIYLSIKYNRIIYLPKSYHVHHIDNNPKNNKIENLQLITVYEHNLIHNPKKEINNVLV